MGTHPTGSGGMEQLSRSVCKTPPPVRCDRLLSFTGSSHLGNPTKHLYHCEKPFDARLRSPFIAKVPFKSDATATTATSTPAIASAATIIYKPGVPPFTPASYFISFSPPQQSLTASVATERTLIGSAVQREVEDAWRSLSELNGPKFERKKTALTQLLLQGC